MGGKFSEDSSYFGMTSGGIFGGYDGREEPEGRRVDVERSGREAEGDKMEYKAMSDNVSRVPERTGEAVNSRRTCGGIGSMASSVHERKCRPDMD